MRPTEAQHDSTGWRARGWVGALVAVAVIGGCQREDPGTTGSADVPPADRPRPVDLEGREVNPLRGADAAATVLIFTRTDCPISNRYAPRVGEIYEAFAPRGVHFWLVYPDPDETPDMIRTHVQEYGHRASVARDVGHVLVEETGVRVTPEAAVYVPGEGQVYRGRIDDRYVDFGKTRPEATRQDLEEVLNAVLEGGPVPDATTTAIGCPIPSLN